MSYQKFKHVIPHKRASLAEDLVSDHYNNPYTEMSSNMYNKYRVPKLTRNTPVDTFSSTCSDREHSSMNSLEHRSTHSSLSDRKSHTVKSAGVTYKNQGPKMSFNRQESESFNEVYAPSRINSNILIDRQRTKKAFNQRHHTTLE